MVKILASPASFHLSLEARALISVLGKEPVMTRPGVLPRSTLMECSLLASGATAVRNAQSPEMTDVAAGQSKS